MEKLCVPIFVNSGACFVGVDVHLVYNKRRRIDSMVENSIFIVASYNDYVSYLFIKQTKAYYVNQVLGSENKLIIGSCQYLLNKKHFVG